jgi:hypothetical protein
VTTSARPAPERPADPGVDSPALTPDLFTVAAVLHDEFDEQVGAAVVDTEIHRVADQFTDVPIRAFVPLFVRRFAGDELDDRTERENPEPDVPAVADHDV